MIIFDIQLGRFSVIAQRETVQHRTLKLTRSGHGETILDLPFCSLTFTEHSNSETSKTT